MGQEMGMVFIRIVDIAVFAETFVSPVVVVVYPSPVPVAVAFDAKVVVAFAGQTASAVIRLQDSLGKCDACGNARAVHLFYGQVFVPLDILPAVFRMAWGNGVLPGRARGDDYQQYQDISEFHAGVCLYQI
jgi:hypothetical protein